MKKQKLKLLKKGMALIIVVLLIFTPTASIATNATSVKDYTSILSIVAQRYKDIKNYKEYVGTIDSFVDELDSNISVKDAQIQIMNKATELQNKYSESAVTSRLTTTITNATMNSKAETTPGLLTEILNKIQNLLGSSNLAIQSLTPDIVVDNMVATTAGDKCGEEYKVKLAGKIYYADKNTNNQPASDDNWVVLLHGVMMNGQAMADSVGQMYIDRGYNVLAIDSRGHGDSEGSVAMGYLESLDVWDWLTYLNTKYTCENIIIHGVSLGGATTIFTSGLTVDGKTLKQDQNVIGLVEDCGYTSLTGIIKGMLGGSSDAEEATEDADTNFVATLFGIEDKKGFSTVLNGGSLIDLLIRTVLINVVDVGLTEANFDDYQDGLESFKNCEVPVLIVHGTKDTTVLFENSDVLYNTAISNESKIPYVQRFVAEGQPHAFVTIGTKYNVYEGHVDNFIKTAESIAEGKKVNKISNYQEVEEKEASLITSLLRALKLIKNMLG